jgi:hypothetical protein
MKKNHFKKIAGVFIIIAIFVSCSQFVAPQKARAQWVTISPTQLVQDLLSNIQQSLSAASGAVTAEATTVSTLQQSVLDKIAVAIAKQLLMKITASVVNWINSGFNGSPAFVQNPAAFFENIGDQITGQFIASNGVLSSLCSPFSLQIRIALATQQQNLASGRYTCTLSTIIQNGTSGVNGFVNGDFSQGGWPAFVALTTVPQNSPSGAYLVSSDDLLQQISKAQNQKQRELNQGGGFLSWQSCTPVPASGSSNSVGPPADYVSVNSAQNYASPSVFGTGDTSLDSAVGLTTSDVNNTISPPVTANTGIAINQPENCQTETPGSVIAGALNKHLAVPSEELELANSVNDIINAAFSQLVVVALQKGLSSVSQPGSGNNGNSYIQDLQNQEGTTSPEFVGAQTTALQAMVPYVTITTQEKQSYGSALASSSFALATLQTAASCYQTTITNLNAIIAGTTTTGATSTLIYPDALPYLQSQLAFSNQQIATTTPIVNSITAKDTMAATTLNQFVTIKSQIQNAQTVAALGIPNQELLALVQSGGIPTATNALEAQQDSTAEQNIIAPIQTTANILLYECQMFNPADRTTYVTATSTAQENQNITLSSSTIAAITTLLQQSAVSTSP